MLYRFASVELIDQIIAADEKWRFIFSKIIGVQKNICNNNNKLICFSRGLTGTIDDLKKQRNIVQKDVATKKKANEACDELVAKIKSIGDEILATELEQKQVDCLSRATSKIKEDLLIHSYLVID